MENRKQLFEKIKEKEKEWVMQINNLRLRANLLDYSASAEYHRSIDKLTTKLLEIEEQTNRVKQISSELPQDLADKVIHCWVESLILIDNAICKLLE